MISIPLDFTGHTVEQRKSRQDTSGITTIALPRWAVALICFLIVTFVGYVWSDLASKITNLSGDITKMQTSINTVTSGLQEDRLAMVKLEAGIDKRLSKIENGMSFMEQRVASLDKPYYKSKATALGFKSDAQIVKTSLKASTAFESETLVDKKQYFIRYKILEYNQSTKLLRIGVEGRMPGVEIGPGNTIVMLVEPGQLSEVVRPFGGPAVYVQILGLPSRDEAILAIGYKEDSTEKAS